MTEATIATGVILAFATGLVVIIVAYFALLSVVTDWMWKRTMPAARQAFIREYFFNRHSAPSIVDGQDDTGGAS